MPGPYVSFHFISSDLDEESGEVPVAFVVRKHGSRLSSAAVMDYVSEQVFHLEVSFIRHEQSQASASMPPPPRLTLGRSLSFEKHGSMFWQVAPYKKVRKVIFTNSIPKSAAGKILRRELRNFIASKL